MNQVCDLCERELRTKLYFEDAKYWVVDCEICSCPMVVLKEHRDSFTDKEREEVVDLLDTLFQIRKASTVPLDWSMRNIKDHAHMHLRFFFS